MNTNKDYINVHPSTVSHDGSGSNGIGYVVRELAKDIHIDGFNPQQGDVLIFDNSLGISSQDELANLITNIHVEADNFIVNFGNEVTLTLTGVQPDQISWDNVIVGDPDTADSNTDDPVTADPGTTDSDVSDPISADPGATDPDGDDPVTADPGTTDPDVSDPISADPGTTDPDGGDSVTADPGTTDPDVSDPISADPGATDPDGDDPVTADPGTTDPGVSDPISADPGTTDPDGGDSVTADPGTTDPDVSDPISADPGATDPDGDDPVTADPGTTDNHGGGRSNGIGHVVREWARDIRIDGFNPQQGDVLIFDNSLGISSQDELANLITNIHVEADNFIVNFGNDVTLTLTGVQPDQISWDNIIVGDPVTADSNTDDPVTADPGTTDPDGDDPVTADPGTTDPDVDDPVTADPGTTDPDGDDPVTADPGTTDNHVGDRSNGIGHVVSEWARDIRIDGFNPQQGDVLIFDNSLGISSQDELANLITNIHVEADNFIVNFGNNTTLTLTDVQPDQIGWDDVIVGDPDTADSNTDDPVTADPSTTDPDVDDPVTADPSSTDPDGDEPVTADPGTSDPDVSDPVTADSGQNIDINPGETIQGEEGSENFVFHDLGHWTINNFNAMEDMLDFTGYNLSREEIASHITNIAVESDNFIVNFGDDVSITLIGQSPTWDNVTTVEG
ncbi:hypothetical protein C8R30_1584 [Nitrosomonas nitrosa]|nr:hypothetical protein C8R30_1584 [Nitrosomonas nitrosa]